MLIFHSFCFKVHNRLHREDNLYKFKITRLKLENQSIVAVEEYLKALLKDLGLDDNIYPDGHNIYTLLIEDDLQIYVKDLNPGFYILCQMMPLPEENQEVLFMALMLGNLFGRGTGGGVLAIDKKSKMLTLSLALPYRISFQEFKNQLEDFTNYIDFWRNEVFNIQEGKPSILLP